MERKKEDNEEKERLSENARHDCMKDKSPKELMGIPDRPGTTKEGKKTNSSTGATKSGTRDTKTSSGSKSGRKK